MSEQMEFDLVSPYLAEAPGVEELRRASRELMQEAEQKARDARLLARLHHEDLVYGPITDELQQLAVLNGRAEFARTYKLWQRRAAKNPRALRQVLLIMKSFLNL